MKKTIDENEFVREFDEFNRSNNFTREARRQLFDYYEQLGDDTGEEVELDVIAICCDWSEYSAEELVQEYAHLVERDEGQDDEDYLEALVSEIQDQSTLIPVDAYGESTTYLVLGF